tara:strand:- start:401 stop:1297 length:897 start_codon:yes stop_codon:yes gene_type:complete
MNKPIKIVFSVFVMVLLVVGCQPTEEKTEPVADDSSQEIIPETEVSVTFQVPTPNELFTLFDQVNVNFNSDLLSSTENIEQKYTSNKNKALCFGVFSADLAFAANFGEASESLKYFSAIRNLGDQLNVNNAFDQVVFDRIEKNIDQNNNDSLFSLSSETYYNAYSYLKENDRGSALSLIIVGGWVESLYILTNLVDENNTNDLLARVADQRLTLENIFGFMAEYQDDEDVSEVMEALIPVEDVLMNLDTQESEISTQVNENGTYNLDGGTEFVLSKEQFDSLKDAVANLRSSIVSSEI